MKIRSLQRITILLLLVGGGGILGWQGYRSLRPTPAREIASAPALLPRWLPLFDRTVPQADRLALARTVDATLPLETLASWSALLSAAPQTQASGADFTVYNEILDQSRQRNLHPVALTPFLLAALNNAKLHPVCRDYAAQHLTLWISTGKTGQPHETDPALRTAALAALCLIPGDPGVRQLSLPGTVLLALADLDASQAADLAPHWPALDTSLIALISDPATPPLLQLAGVQTAALSRRVAVLPSLRQLIREPGTGEPLLLALAGALGRLGDSTDRPLLTALAASGTAAAPAAVAALARLPF